MISLFLYVTGFEVECSKIYLNNLEDKIRRNKTRIDKEAPLLFLLVLPDDKRLHYMTKVKEQIRNSFNNGSIIIT